MTSSINNVSRGTVDGGGVELVNIRVLSTDKTEPDGQINEGFLPEDESIVHSATQQTANLTSSLQVNTA